MTDDAMISSTLERMLKDAQASGLLLLAAQQIELAGVLNGETDLAPGGHEAQQFITVSLEHLVRRQALTLRDRARERAGQLGWQVATYEIAPEAKESGTEPIAWITGNNYMPPLRAYGVSEQVWQVSTTDNDLWTAYVERLESRLEELRVYMATPEYDNALFVVDLERFEFFVEEPDASDTLDGMFRAIEAPEQS